MSPEEAKEKAGAAMEALERRSEGEVTTPVAAPAEEPVERNLYDFEVFLIDHIKTLRQTVKPRLLEPLYQACLTLASIGDKKALEGLKQVSMLLGFKPKTIQIKLNDEQILLLKAGKLDVNALAQQYMATDASRGILLPFPSREEKVDPPLPPLDLPQAQEPVNENNQPES